MEPQISVWGNVNDFKKIFSIDNREENYRREIYGYEVENLGVALAFTGDVNETGFATSTLIAGATIVEETNESGEVIARKVIKKV